MIKENIQLISWSIEISTFIVADIIVGLIWRVSKRASENKKSEQQVHQKENEK